MVLTVVLVLWGLLLNPNQGLMLDPLGRSPARKMALSSTPPQQQQTTPRVKHKNKYSEFSKRAELDPLEQAMKRQDLAAAAKELKKAAPSRGTTVPTLAASPKKRPPRSSNSSVESSLPNLPSSSQMNATSPDAPATPVTPVNIYDTIVPSDPFTFGYVQIGKCLGPHGVHGEVKLQMETDFADSRLQPGSLLYVKRPNRLTPRPVRVEDGRRQVDSTYLVRLQGVKSRLSALSFKGFMVYVKTEDRPALQKDEYLVRDLVGLCCVVEAGGERRVVGEVVGVVLPEELCDNPTAAKLMHAMIEVKKVNSQELTLLPLVPQIVVRVDLAAKTIWLDPPGGLLDLVYVEKEKTVSLRGFLPERSSYLTAQARSWLEKQSILLFP